MSKLLARWIINRLTAPGASETERREAISELASLEMSKINWDEPGVLTAIAHEFFNAEDEAVRMAAVALIAKGAPVADLRALPVMLAAAADENLEIRRVAVEALMQRGVILPRF
ncbi:hypothetical protein [Candidatus Laterigemmans baculatus]|uniref:hypothetical protein n=1 Tax=Candidatus Laterigemmans baculatus TaxID=2770505 RepID=UPI0013D9BFAA|nr:hypothetical protein [Candidatus Laterigemmans baculatus]